MTKDDELAQRGVPMRDFSRSLPMALLRAREAVMRHFRPELRRRGVTEQQWRILRALASLGPVEVMALAKATLLYPPSVSRIVPDLEARGFIVRTPVDSDRRRAVVSLRPAGLRMIALHAPASEEIYDGITRAIGNERLTQLFGLLNELEAALEQLQPGTGVRPQRRSAKPPARRVRSR